MLATLLLALVPAADAEPVKATATAPWTHAKADPDAKNDAKQIVIRNAADLVKAIPSYAALDAPANVVEKMANEALAKALKVKEIDWKKQMLIVVTGGSKPTGGYSVQVTGLKKKDKTLTVAWTVNKPKGFVTQAFTHPGVVVLVPAHEGKVEFDPAAKK
jgi:hypothetical protein